ncbi:hypothetical protein ABE65_010980 [Fictibacillus phosphorivorans]|uniref:Uncharacterized protein n=1 Tax=Fictibacillus phosphorivorans TaxID=1221500 RepID=A0A160IMR2_9BACL|nr:hypothetical protein [Fictibacillus phosphorivorans]ANC77297.1 hypothetical protein ABE65_010980 [Fictibacillus phosphorivorans]
MNLANKGAVWVLIIFAFFTIIFTFVELNQPYETPEDAQSRFEIHIPPLYTFLMIGATYIVHKWNKKLHLFAGPCFILLGGFWYLWIFRTFTTGWVMMQGLVGLFISIITCFILVIFHLFTIRKRTR